VSKNFQRVKDWLYVKCNGRVFILNEFNVLVLKSLNS
jgi:hypothetical protein